jgi:hypothetical protein
MASFTAAGTAYATHGEPMIPFFIFYSMFGFQRTGDEIWAFADARGRGFLLGATAGRTTLNGEGLQHEDGHSLVLASDLPNMSSYDPAFAYEIATSSSATACGGCTARRRGRLLLPDAVQRELRDATSASDSVVPTPRARQPAVYAWRPTLLVRTLCVACTRSARQRSVTSLVGSRLAVKMRRWVPECRCFGIENLRENDAENLVYATLVELTREPRSRPTAPTRLDEVVATAPTVGEEPVAAHTGGGTNGAATRRKSGKR